MIYFFKAECHKKAHLLADGAVEQAVDEGVEDGGEVEEEGGHPLGGTHGFNSCRYVENSIL